MEGRFDAIFYTPSIVAIENEIRKKANGKLRDYIVKMASGATPSVKEEEKFYGNSENGIPFIRVQNLSPTNELVLEDVKYINLETHKKDLKRSQVCEDDLLVKITGVGRMAVASIAPKDFVGNTNQHLVVIKTNNLLTSQVLATFLNTDIGEKLASRRSTGGTRPALDYTALKSIPIIFNPKIVEIMQTAYASKRQKEAEATALLGSIDAYLMEALGIKVAEGSAGFENPPNLNKPYFLASAQELRGNRWDSFYYKAEFKELEKAINNSSYPIILLKEVLSFLESGSRPSGGVSEYESGILSLGGEHVNDKCQIEIRNPKYVPLEYHEAHLNTETKLHDILLVKDGATTGKIGVIENIEHVGQNVNEHVFLMRFNEKVNSYFIIYLLATNLYQKRIKRVITGATVTGLTKQVVRDMTIPLPPLEIQTQIAAHISDLRTKAKTLQAEAAAEIAVAKAKVEEMLLG